MNISSILWPRRRRAFWTSKCQMWSWELRRRQQQQQQHPELWKPHSSKPREIAQARIYVLHVYIYVYINSIRKWLKGALGAQWYLHLPLDLRTCLWCRYLLSGRDSWWIAESFWNLIELILYQKSGLVHAKTTNGMFKQKIWNFQGKEIQIYFMSSIVLMWPYLLHNYLPYIFSKYTLGNYKQIKKANKYDVIKFIII